MQSFFSDSAGVVRGKWRLVACLADRENYENLKDIHLCPDSNLDTLRHETARSFKCSVISQKTRIFLSTAMRTSDLARNLLIASTVFFKK